MPNNTIGILIRVLRWSGRLGMVLLLTILTQVGGLAYVLNLLAARWINGRVANPWARRGVTFGSFVVLYLFLSLAIVPLLARANGRVPLPWGTDHHVRPHSIWTCLLNRHYVRPEMRDLVFSTGDRMAAQFPGTTLTYLDANFPLLNGFPLVPHLSHKDGKKLDLSFLYQDPVTEAPRDGAPGWLGYGIHADPLPGESDQSETCEAKGNWQYDLLHYIVPQGAKDHYALDTRRTKALIYFLLAEPQTGKIFLEPHLKARMGIVSDKVRFQGCQSVRHDDHIHLQLP